MVDGDVAHLLARPDVLPRVVEVAGVGLVPGGRARRVRGEDAVLGRGGLVSVVSGGRRQVAALVAMEADLGAVGPAVPPDLVAGIAAAAEEVAGGEVVDGDIVGLPHHDPIAPDGLATGVGGAEGLLARIRAAGTGGAGLGPVDDHRRAVHTPHVDVGGGRVT